MREQLWSIVMSTSCVCLSVHEDIFQTTCAIFTKCLCMLPMAVAQSSPGRVMKSQWNGKGVLFPIDNALYSIAFRAHTKRAEPIEMPFGMMNVLGPGNKCVTWGWECPKGKVNSIFGETYPTSLIPLIIANWTGPYSGTQQEQTLDCKHWTSIVGRFCGWHRFSRPYSSMIFAMKDQFHLNLLIYLELVGWLEFNGAYLQT